MGDTGIEPTTCWEEPRRNPVAPAPASDSPSISVGPSHDRPPHIRAASRSPQPLTQGKRAAARGGGVGNAQQCRSVWCAAPQLVCPSLRFDSPGAADSSGRRERWILGVPDPGDAAGTDPNPLQYKPRTEA
ncbi:unnamed protein product [Pleuronectes platessa]|uniref:Uncharacterized protein n=1 Tax=Pleuronectes platessa TaxID=8262 RepID=A0A9N7TPF8_PLEPL|nr:unnamed protein product [Pleuronectes platessa]